MHLVRFGYATRSLEEARRESGGPDEFQEPDADEHRVPELAETSQA